MIKLSLIIPVYKVESYIEECIRSISKQIIPDIEVIIINDGTPDSSMEIIELIINELSLELQKCFKIINQTNQGQSIARNRGLEMAIGEYIGFIDSDDIVSSCYIEKLLEIVNYKKYDIIKFNSRRFKKNINEKINFNTSIHEITGEYKLTRGLLVEYCNKAAWYPWLNIYKRDLFKNEKFPIDIYFEDTVLILDIFLKSNSLYYMGDVLYFYRINENGSLLDTSSINIEKKKYSYQFVVDYFNEKVSVNKVYSPSLIIVFHGYVDFLLRYCGTKVAYTEYKRVKKGLNNIEFNYVKNKGNRFFYLFGFVFLLFLRLIRK